MSVSRELAYLAIETSAACSSVALWCEGSEPLLRTSTEHNDHAVVLTTMIEELLSKASRSLSELSAIGISQGPGSSTGLRIGYATAKGLAFATGLPLITIPTLTALASAIEREIGKRTSATDYCIVPMIDARRMEVYTQTFLPPLQAITPPYPCILDSTPPQHPDGVHAYYAGSGARKAQNILCPTEWTFIDYPRVLATDLLPILKNRYLDNHYEDLAYAEPLYLKEFEATPSRKTPLCNTSCAQSKSSS